jgi:hypothetical protein
MGRPSWPALTCLYTGCQFATRNDIGSCLCRRKLLGSMNIMQSTKLPSTAAHRMRAYRKRRRQGLQCVRIELHVTDVESLIRVGPLKEGQRQDPEAVQAAVTGLIYRALEDST